MALKIIDICYNKTCSNVFNEVLRMFLSVRPLPSSTDLKVMVTFTSQAFKIQKVAAEDTSLVTSSKLYRFKKEWILSMILQEFSIIVCSTLWSSPDF